MGGTFGVVAVNVENRSVDHLANIRAVKRRPGRCRWSRVTDAGEDGGGESLVEEGSVSVLLVAGGRRRKEVRRAVLGERRKVLT